MYGAVLEGTSMCLGTMKYIMAQSGLPCATPVTTLTSSESLANH